MPCFYSYKNMSKNSKKKKRTAAGQAVKKMERFELLNPHSAGIDIGSMLMVVSYTDREGMINVREFDSFTNSLYELAELLQSQGVEKAVMEATGPYWESLYNILEKHGMEMFLCQSKSLQERIGPENRYKRCAVAASAIGTWAYTQLPHCP